MIASIHGTLRLSSAGALLDICCGNDVVTRKFPGIAGGRWALIS